MSRSLAITADLLKKSAEHPGWQRQRAEALLEQAQQLPAAGARLSLAAARTLLEPLAAQQPDDRSVLLAATTARLRTAQLDPSPQAQSLMRKALAACDAQSGGARDPRLRVLRVELLFELGEVPQATIAAGELWRDGYREPGFAALLQARGVAAPSVAAATLPH